MTKKYTAKPYSYLVIHTTLVSDNPLRFRNNLLERILKLIMTTDDKIRDEKYRSCKISALSSRQFDKNDYLAGEELVPSGQGRLTEQTKFTYPVIGRTLKKQTKTIEDQGEKQIKAIWKTTG